MGLGLSSNISVLEDLVDPLSEVGDPCVHARLVLLGTADAPTDDAGQHEPTVGLPLHRHRPSRVSLNQRNLNQSLKPRLCPPDVFYHLNFPGGDVWSVDQKETEEKKIVNVEEFC